jgi:hypothetical protein
MLLFALGAGCSYQRDDQAPEVGVAAEGSEAGGERDYRVMLERARNRKAYQHSLEQVKDAIEKFQVELGRLPTNLYEVVRFRYLDEFPEQVPAGYTWGYDSVHGRVSFIKVPEEGQAGTPAE